jgi:magnesium chelatase accessory protein
MMSQWRLDRLLSDLPHIQTKTVLIAGTADKAVPTEVSEHAASVMPDARFISLPGLGHLAHEEQPDTICDLIRDILRKEGIVPS